MIDFTHSEALLFRVLTSFFGAEHVIPYMSVLAVCGGSLPSSVRQRGLNSSIPLNPASKEVDDSQLLGWAKRNKCLFTVINPEHEPRMVFEFFSGFHDSFTVTDAEHSRILPVVLKAAGVTYCTISNEEFSEILDPRSSLDFCAFLKAKCEALGMSL